VAEAFADFRQLDLARQWHLEVLPADATRISSEVRLQQIYASFIDTGNRLYFSAGRAELARETFRAAEENRASSLYQLLSEAGDWRRRLPAGYWEKLAKLHVVEVAMLRQDTGALRSRMASLRSEILEEEAEAGSDTQAGGDHLLERTQSTLPADAVLLSFHLGECESDLWAVSREQFRIYRLPTKAALGTTIGRFADAVRNGNLVLAARTLGQQLYGDLFGRLDPQLERKPRWILALDENLFQVPFDALVIAPAEAGPQPLDLTLDLRGLPEFSIYDVKIVNTEGQAVWQSTGEIHAGKNPDAVAERPWPRRSLRSSLLAVAGIASRICVANSVTQTRRHAGPQNTRRFSLSIANFAVSATAITAITPACTGSVTTRSAASGTLPAMLRLMTRRPD